MQKPIRVALLADSPLNSLKRGSCGRAAGGATWLPQIASHFAKRRELEFYWISFDSSLTNPERETFEGITYIRHPKIPRQLDDLAALFPSKRILRREISSIAPDVIHAWGSEGTYASVIKGSRQPTIFSLQGLLKRYQEVGGLPRSIRLRMTHPSWRLAARRERSFVNSATVVTAESDWAIQLLNKYYKPKETRIVEYGVHPSFYSTPWQPQETSPSFLFIGSLADIKGVPTLVEAVEKCRTSGWQLYLVGEGPLRGWVERQTLRSVKCLGLLEWDELQTKLSQAWALIHPTKADTSPNAVKEARVVGLPVITTNEGGQGGYVRHEENGIIVPVSNPESLARAIDLLAGDFEMVKRMGQTNHARDREYFRPEKTAESFVDLYLELARRAANQL
jgi:glycosyltransferase involved in cell wall biosynthesis